MEGAKANQKYAQNIGESTYDAGHDLSVMEMLRFKELNEDRGAEELDAFG